MNIPSSFQMAGHKITVRMVAGLCRNHGCVGMCVYEQNEIMLDPDGAQSRIEHAFLHEVAHMVHHVLGENEKAEDERYMDSLSAMLHQFLVTQDGSV